MSAESNPHQHGSTAWLVVEVRRLEAETERLRGVVESLICAFGGHDSHWDRTMSHGAGCEQCHRERDARNVARDALAVRP